jgi:virulence factor
MLKIGIIGLGDIAQKAYLPVLSSKDLEIHLFTRNQERLTQIGRQYRMNNLHSSSGIYPRKWYQRGFCSYRNRIA